MYYRYEVTTPTKIECVADYKERIYEITHGQMRNIVLKERLLNPFFWLFSVFTIPMSVAYFLLCVCEIIVDTILLPFSCIPYIRAIPFLVSVLVWSVGVAVGVFSIVPLTYDVNYRPKKSKKETKAERTISELRQAVVAEKIDEAQRLYVYYGVGSRFSDDMGALCEEYEGTLTSCKDKFALISAARRCTAISMYHLFDLWEIYRDKKIAVSAIAQIIYNETHNGRAYSTSFLNSKSWLDVRLALISKIKNFVPYGQKRYAL